MTLKRLEQSVLRVAGRALARMADEERRTAGLESVDSADQAVKSARKQHKVVEGRTDQPPWPFRNDRRKTARPRPEADRPAVAGEKVQEPDENMCGTRPAFRIADGNNQA